MWIHNSNGLKIINKTAINLSFPHPLSDLPKTRIFLKNRSNLCHFSFQNLNAYDIRKPPSKFRISRTQYRKKPAVSLSIIYLLEPKKKIFQSAC